MSGYGANPLILATTGRTVLALTYCSCFVPDCVFEISCDYVLQAALDLVQPQDALAMLGELLKPYAAVVLYLPK